MDEFAEINITPFTDVLLVLLIIFIMLAALIVPAGFEKQLNNCTGCAGPAQKTSPHAELAISQSGIMSLDGRIVDDRTIYGALSALHAAHANIALQIEGDTKAPYRFVIRAMDAAKAASINNVSFVTK